MTTPLHLRRLEAPLCSLGEGPTYDRHTDTAWWFDILGRKLLEHRFGDGVTIVHDLPFAASALARIDAGRQLVFAETGLHIRDVETGKLDLHLAIEADDPATRSNDARVHQSGAFWLGTMGWEAEPDAGSIYHYRAGKLTKLFDAITISNGICFSPDGTIGYFTDTAHRRVMRVPLDPATGFPAGEATPFLTYFPENGGPDGAVTDAAGNMWIALWGAGIVAGYSSDGEYLQTIALPASQVSCPAFVGINAGAMLVTSARVGLEDSTDSSGATFVFDLPFRGRFEPDVVIK